MIRYLDTKHKCQRHESVPDRVSKHGAPTQWAAIRKLKDGRNYLCTYASWGSLKDIRSEKNQTEKLHMIPFTYNLQKKKIHTERKDISGCWGQRTEWVQTSARELPERWKRSPTGKWWQLYSSISLMKTIKFYAHGRWILWCINYTSMQSFKRKSIPGRR